MKRIELKGRIKVGDKLRVTNYSAHSALHPVINTVVIEVQATFFRMSGQGTSFDRWYMHFNPKDDNDYDERDGTDYQIVNSVCHPRLKPKPTL